MDHLKTAKLIALGRLLFGLGAMVAPARMVPTPTGERFPGSTLVLLRIFGVRDAVLGGGTLRALSDPEPDTRWVAVGALADSGDVLVALASRRHTGLLSTMGTVAVALPAAALGWTSFRNLRP